MTHENGHEHEHVYVARTRKRIRNTTDKHKLGHETHKMDTNMLEKHKYLHGHEHGHKYGHKHGTHKWTRHG